MNDPVVIIRKICLYAALAFALVSIAKMLGVSVSVIRASITELAAVGILCALVGK